MNKYQLYTKADRRSPKNKMCACGNHAFKFSCGAFCCERCAAIESKLDAGFVRANFSVRPAWKYFAPFAIHLPGNRAFIP